MRNLTQGLILAIVLANGVSRAEDTPELRRARSVPRAGDTEADEEGTFKERMAEARSVPKMARNSRGGGYLGLNAQAGQVYSAEPKSSAGVAIMYGVEPGYIMQNDSWGRLELGLGVRGGMFNYNEDGGAKNDITMNYAIMPRFGYGYSLGAGLFGLFDLTAGPASMDVKLSINDLAMKSTNNTAFLFGGGYKFVFEGEGFEAFVGIDVYHAGFSMKKVERPRKNR